MRNVDFSREPRSAVEHLLAVVLGRAPSAREVEDVISAGTLTNRKCENPLCDWKLQQVQARFCTRCWKAIELCRALDAGVSAEGPRAPMTDRSASSPTAPARRSSNEGQRRPS